VGGITSSVHRLAVCFADGTTTQVVVKRFTDLSADDAVENIENEAAALLAMEHTKVPAPVLIGASPDGADTEGVPALIMTRAPGRVSLTPRDMDTWIRQLACLLPSVHAAADGWLTVEPRDRTQETVPVSVRRPDLWAAAKSAIATESPPREAAFVHGDYQHFNVLWSRGRLTSLVDWTFSRLAPPDVDVSHCRLNLAVLFSAEVAERFRQIYEAEAGRQVEPWWDLHRLLAYDDTWQDFIPVQVAGRCAIDVRGMTGRVEDLLALTLKRI
jgi:aminoglycoside phosphotransferase (APT) family kinase protein